MKRLLFVVFAFFFLINCLSAQNIVFVDSDALGANNGSSWTDAYTDLQTAINSANATDTLLLATDTIIVSVTIDVSDKDLVIKGGFDPTTNIQTDYTTLDGNSNNLVIAASNLTNASYFDRLIVENGSHTGHGGGMTNTSSSPRMNNMIFRNNVANVANAASSEGGGVYNYSSSPILTNVEFFNNSARNGGGLACIGGSTELINVVFNENTSSRSGGGLFCQQATLTGTNVLFNNNTATTVGGGLMNTVKSSVTLTNATFYNNNGGAIYNQYLGVASFNSKLFLYNTLFFGNEYNGTTVDVDGTATNNNSEYNASDVSSSSLDNGNVFVALTNDPFTNSSNPVGDDGTWRTSDDGLIPANSVVDAGNNSLNSLSFDLADTLRIINLIIDIGAYESPIVSVVAYPDSIEVCPYTAQTNIVNVMDNDSSAGAVVDQTLYKITEVNNYSGGVVSVNEDGSVDITAGAEPGTTYYVEYQITDTTDNSQYDTDSLVVMVYDTVSAGEDNSVFLCGNADEVDLDTILGGTPDAGGTWTPTLTDGVFDPANNAAGIYMYVVADANCGNNDTAYVTVTVDTAGPEITAPKDTIVYPDVDCNIDSTVSAIGNLLSISDDYTDSADVIVGYVDEGDFTNCNDTVTRKWYAIDACGNVSDTVEQYIVRFDTIAPTFTVVPNDTTVDCDAIPDTAGVKVVDNCGTVTITYSEDTVYGYDIEFIKSQIVYSKYENSTKYVAKVSENIAGSDSDKVTYTLDKLYDYDDFTLNSNTALLAFKSSPDFEDPTDDDKNNTYTIIVRASIGDFSITYQVVVNVLNDIFG
jgi:predicted outer membrane repeat protein